ncbi:peptidoglycan-binding protein [Streptomyces glaucus]|uniref:Peptidoglycan-binding domain-containing protein n=1 Tax=Streptomyces glaucus TaxID=284029 RepID=A0ABN3KE17_9ACTN
MAEPRDHRCPECGAPRSADRTPSCGCTRRASDALREAREAEAAAAEDFDPLHIRPYVELRNPQEAPPPPRTSGPDATTRLRPVPPRTPDAEAAAALPTPLASPPGEPSGTGLRRFETAEPADAVPAGAGGPDGAEPRRRRRGALLGAARALVAVVAATGYVSGLFSYEPPSRNGPPPADLRASVPDTSPGAASVAPAVPGTASARPASAPPSPSAGGSPSPTPSPSASSASPTPSRSRSAEPSPSPTSARATAPTAREESGDDRDQDVLVLRPGDRGPEVTELQLRLRQLYLYHDDADGHYTGRVEDAVRTYQWSRGIRSDQLGVYGPRTRGRLESETREP